MNPGQRIDRFIIERLLGRGGMAEVYLARDTQLARRVALKRLRGGRGDATSTVRFLREARFASAFHHPCAVVVYDIFEHDDQPYIAMEFVEGKTLRALVGDASQPAGRRLRWIVDAARALGAAHRAGLVHRDVKPHNIMVTDDGRVKVLDFGIARVDRAVGLSSSSDSDDDSLSGITQTGAIVGTPLYSSPEQLSGQPVDSRSDQFSWALTAYELLCGYLPWRRRDAMTVLAQLVADDVPSMGERLAEIASEVREPHTRISDPTVRISDPTSPSAPPPPPDPALFDGVPLGVEPVIACALARDPERRFPTIDDAADALEEYADDPRSVAVGRGVRAGVSMTPPTSPASSPTPGKSGSGAGSRRTPGRTTIRLPRAADARPPLPSANDGRTPRDGRHVRASETSPAARDSAPVSVRSPKLQAAADELGSSPPTPTRPTPRSATPTPVAVSSVGPSSAPASESDLDISRPALLDAPPFDPRLSSPTLRASGTPPPEKRAWWLRKPLATAAAAGALLLGTMLGLSRLIETAPAGKPATLPTALAAASPASSEVGRVPCGQADVRGSFVVPDAPLLLGSAACVRLAVELGVPWTMQPAEAPLRVVVDTTGAPVKVTLSFGGVEARGEGKKPIDAIQAAIPALAAGLHAPAITAGARAAWGADTPEAAARALRETRRAGLLLSPDPRAELSRWADQDAHSPWPWLLFASVSEVGDPAAANGRTRALPLLGGLSPERATLAQGLLFGRDAAGPSDAAEGLRKLRRAYVIAPDDAEVEAVLATALFRAGRTDEAMPVARRLFTRGGPAGLAALVVAADDDADPQWIDERGRVLDALETWLPEARAWPSRVRHELSAGRIDAAQRSIDVGAALGLPVTARTGDLGRAWIALERLDAARVREIVRPLVMSPDPALSNEAVRLLVQAYLLEGRAGDAETELARDIERQIAFGNDEVLASRTAWLLSICRRLGQPAPPFLDAAKVRALVDRLAAHDDPTALALEVELTALLVDSGAEKPAAAEALLARAEGLATRAAQGDRAAHDAVLASAAPLEGVVHSAKDALKWHRSLKAPYAARLPNLFALGQLCEQGNDTAYAEASYRDASRSPATIDALEYLSARLRLAKLIEKRGDAAEAARLRDPVQKLLASADPDAARLLERRTK